jgi:hypothetical protein
MSAMKILMVIDSLAKGRKESENNLTLSKRPESTWPCIPGL